MRYESIRNMTREMALLAVLALVVSPLLSSMDQEVFAASRNAQPINKMALVALPNDKTGLSNDGMAIQDKIEIKTWGYTNPTSGLQKPAVNPVANISNRSGGASASPFEVLQNPINPVFSEKCLVDFSDWDALNGLWGDPAYPGTQYAESMFAVVPWWDQTCGSLGLKVTVRPIGQNHHHLNYEDIHIQPCPSNPVEYAIVHQDGTCEDIDPREQPRTLSGHTGQHQVHIQVYDSHDYDMSPFKLNRIRVKSEQSIELCYKPVQEVEGPWKTTQTDGSTLPGIWYCWKELHTGYWDLSDWTDDITDVIIRSSNDEAAPYTVDDIEIGVP